MKKIYTILALLFTVSMANASIHTVTVNASSFAPTTVAAVCGDTVAWILGSGSHTTTSTTIPVGAASWNSPINSTTPSYSITVTIAGTYNYKCTPHGFIGIISVNCPSGVVSLSNNYFSSSYPNPFSGKLIIETADADLISIYNLVGEKIKTITLQHGQTKAEINAVDLREGVYFYSIIKEGIVIETRKVIKN